MGAYKGIDIYHKQGIVDFKKVKADGYDFVILQAGYGKYASQKDAMFETYYKDAKSAGLLVGAYWFSYNYTVENAKAEAEICKQILQGKQFELPIFYDIENKAHFALGKKKLSECVTAFFKVLENAGYYPGLYCSTSYMDYFTDEIKEKYPLWIAQYASKNTYKGPGEIGIWQFSETGKVKGISTNTDLNIAYVDYPEIIKSKGLNGYKKMASTTKTETVKKKVPLYETYLLKDMTYSGVKTYSKAKDGNKKLSEHFSVKEWACKDGSDTIKINLAIVPVLEALYARLDAKAINITSGYRTPAHSVRVGGYATDQHTKGNAVDITVKKKNGSLCSSTAICCALEDMNHKGGIGRINRTDSVHVDVRGTKCWFDECNGECAVGSWHSYLGYKTVTKEPTTTITVTQVVETSKPSTSTSGKTKTVTATHKADKYNKNIAGLYTVSSTGGLYLRDGAGTKYKALVLMPKGTHVNNYGYYSNNNGKWYYVTTTIGNTTYTGFCAGNYLKKVK